MGSGIVTLIEVSTPRRRSCWPTILGTLIALLYAVAIQRYVVARRRAPS